MAWCWWSNSTWECYEAEQSQQIEAAFRAKHPSVTINVGGYPYDVDLIKQYQRNQLTGFRRKIWRCSEQMPENVHMLKWLVEGEELDLVSCSFLSIRYHQNMGSCHYWQHDDQYEVDFLEMTRRHVFASKIERLSLAGTIPPVSVSKGLLESDIIAETPASSDETCCICLDGFEEKAAVRLRLCSGHWFHRECIEKAFKSRHKCPMCSIMYTPAIGTQPPGQMLIEQRQGGLPGFEEYGKIMLRYVFPFGFQSHEHPHPGLPYYGTTRIAYLPDSPEGNEVLQLLVEAWRRRLIFTISRSMTTGIDDSVVWNGVHHKTSIRGGPAGHGYPDPNYFCSVKEELANLGVCFDEMVID